MPREIFGDQLTPLFSAYASYSRSVRTIIGIRLSAKTWRHDQHRHILTHPLNRRVLTLRLLAVTMCVKPEKTLSGKNLFRIKTTEEKKTSAQCTLSIYVYPLNLCTPSQSVYTSLICVHSLNLRTPPQSYTLMVSICF